METVELYLEPAAAYVLVLEQDQAPAHRTDGDIEIPVVVVVGRCTPTRQERPDPVQADLIAELLEAPGHSLGGQVAERLDELLVPGEVRDRDLAVDDHEVEIRVEIEVSPGHTPAGGTT